MKERPILFSAPMVRALLDGSKTQTRRVVKPQPHIDAQGNFCWNGSNFGQDFSGPHIQSIASPLPSSRTGRVLCPYGRPGDRLWVREAWRTYRGNDATPPRDLTTAHRIWCEADDRCNAAAGKLRPSMFMPRWASRITLEITSVRVERLQDITRGDAMAEGCPFPNMAQGDDPRQWYEQLWGEINGPDSWATNPWVWAIEFKRIKQEAA